MSAPDLVVTMHARERWIERIDGQATIASAGATIAAHSEAVRAAARFRYHCVKLPCGARLIIDGLNVVTVLARGKLPSRGPHPWKGASHAL